MKSPRLWRRAYSLTSSRKCLDRYVCVEEVEGEYVRGREKGVCMWKGGVCVWRRWRECVCGREKGVCMWKRRRSVCVEGGGGRVCVEREGVCV